jgi:LDH2 family malate/lactate/ureidoglycolate dehydrogenase
MHVYDPRLLINVNITAAAFERFGREKPRKCHCPRRVPGQRKTRRRTERKAAAKHGIEIPRAWWAQRSAIFQS